MPDTALKRNSAVRFRGEGDESKLRQIFDAQVKAWSDRKPFARFVYEAGQGWGVVAFPTVHDAPKVMPSGKETANLAYNNEFAHSYGVAEGITSGTQSTSLSWEFDQKFYGLTTLYSPKASQIDVCVIHGLNGHAFETWTARQNKVVEGHSKSLKDRVAAVFKRKKTGKTKQLNVSRTTWIQELLPDAFQQPDCRVLTYGYNANLLEDMNKSNLEDWARGLLGDIDENRRKCQMRRDRPLILVAHSLGGFVARKAMEFLHRDLHSSPNIRREFPTLKLPGCGVMFLATPHSGSKSAGGGFAEFATSLVGGRSEITRMLQIFDRTMDENQKAWIQFTNQCPYVCLHESSKTATIKGPTMVVEKNSAGFLKPAMELPHTDHHTICAYMSGTDNSYWKVRSELRKLREDIEVLLSVVTDNKPTPPGRVSQTAPAVKLKHGILSGNKSVLMPSEFHVPRADFLKNMRAWKAKSERPMVLAGAGGIGKSELVKRFVMDSKENSYVFWVNGNQKFAKKLLDFAVTVGAELLLEQRSPHHWPPDNKSFHDVLQEWSMATDEQKITLFLNWLDNQPERQAFLVIDDIHTKGGSEKNELRATNVIYTSRDPFLMGELKPRVLGIVPMTLAQGMELAHRLIAEGHVKNPNFLDTADYRIALAQFASALGNNPRAIYCAVLFMRRRIRRWDPEPGLQNVVDQYLGDGFDLRHRILTFDPDGSNQSTMDTFKQSLRRLEREDNLQLDLLSVMSILQAGNSVDAEDFFTVADHVFVREKFGPGQISNIFSRTQMELGELEDDLTRAGLLSPAWGASKQVDRPWSDCSLELIGEDRYRLLEGLINICSALVQETPENLERVKPFLSSCKTTLLRYFHSEHYKTVSLLHQVALYV